MDVLSSSGARSVRRVDGEAGLNIVRIDDRNGAFSFDIVEEDAEAKVERENRKSSLIRKIKDATSSAFQ